MRSSGRSRPTASTTHRDPSRGHVVAALARAAGIVAIDRVPLSPAAGRSRSAPPSSGTRSGPGGPPRSRSSTKSCGYTASNRLERVAACTRASSSPKTAATRRSSFRWRPRRPASVGCVSSSCRRRSSRSWCTGTGRRHRPHVRRAGKARHRARHQCRRTGARVLRRGRDRHTRCRAVAYRDRLADLPDEPRPDLVRGFCEFGDGTGAVTRAVARAGVRA